MSLSARTIKVSYTAAGGTDFAMPDVPLVSDSSEVVVYLRDETTTPATVTLQTEGPANDYTLTGAPLPGDFNTTVSFNSAPTSGLKVGILLQLPLTQPLDIATGSGIPADSLELELDRAVGMIQQLQERVDRMPYLGPSEQIAVADMEMAEPQATYLIGWDDDGDKLTSYSPEAVALAAAGIADTDDLAEGSVNLYYTDGRADARADVRIAASTINTLTETLTTKGDIYVRDGTDVKRLAIGSDTQVLTADSAESLGVKWAAAGATEAVTNVSSFPYTVLAADQVIIASGASGQIDLPAATGSGRKLKIVHGGTSLTQVYTIDGNTTDTIRGALTFLLHTNGQVVEIIDSASGAWTVLNHQTKTGLVSFTPSTTLSTNATWTGQWWRDSEYMYGQVYGTFSGATDSATFAFTLPGSQTVASAKLLDSSTNGTGDILGHCKVLDDSSAIGLEFITGQVQYASSTTLQLSIFETPAGVTHFMREVTNTIPVTIASGDKISFEFKVPITNWEY
jgi:hypothetical protein